MGLVMNQHYLLARRQAPECRQLLTYVNKFKDGSKRSRSDHRPLYHFWHGEYVLLDIRGKIEKVHYLSHPGAGETFPSGYVGLGDAFPGFYKFLPLHCLPEKLYDSRRPGRFLPSGRLRQ